MGTFDRIPIHLHGFELKMNRTFNRLESFVFISDIIITCMGLYTASYLRDALPIGRPLGEIGASLPVFVYAIAVLCWSGSLLLVGAYDTKHTDRNWFIITRVIFGGLLATLIFAGILFLTFREVSRLQFVYFFLINLFLLLFYRWILFGILQPRLSTPIFDHTRVIMIGAGDLAQEVVQQVQTNPIWGYDIVGYIEDDPDRRKRTYNGLEVLGTLDDLLPILETHEVLEIWSTLPPNAYDKLHSLVARLENFPVRIKVIPDYFSLALVKAKIEMIGGFPVIGLREPVIDGVNRVIKRGFDILTCVALIVFASPMMFFIALLVAMEGSGAVIFRQTRVGENGVLFTMYKFRTMIQSEEAHAFQSESKTTQQPLQPKRRDDPRISKLGHILRRFSLDELPQLFNVLKGDMSLVGPRPEMPWLVELYKPWQRKRFAVPQGLTGWWQINGRSEKPMHQNTDEDLYYIYNYSLLLDILIIIRTPFAVIQGRGAF